MRVMQVAVMKKALCRIKRAGKETRKKVGVQAEGRAQPTALICSKTLLIKLELLKLQSETSFQSVLRFCKVAD